jgi:hypothetical protein
MNNINIIIKYLNQIKNFIDTNKLDNIINILIDLLETNHIKEFLRRYDIFIIDINNKYKK